MIVGLLLRTRGETCDDRIVDSVNPFLIVPVYGVRHVLIDVVTCRPDLRSSQTFNSKAEPNRFEERLRQKKKKLSTVHGTRDLFLDSCAK